MASNYNQMQNHLYFLKDGKAREVIKRQSLRQLGLLTILNNNYQFENTLRMFKEKMVYNKLD